MMDLDILGKLVRDAGYLIATVYCRNGNDMS